MVVIELVPITALLIGAPSLSAMISSPDPIGYLLTSHGKTAANDQVSRLHASILMAGRHQEAA